MVRAEMNSSWGRLSEDGGMRLAGQEGKNSIQMRALEVAAREKVRIGRSVRARRF
jgi:hypothetical protein